METLVFTEARLGPVVHVSITISGPARSTGCLQRFHLRQIRGKTRGAQQYGRGRRLLAAIGLTSFPTKVLGHFVCVLAIR